LRAVCRLPSVRNHAATRVELPPLVSQHLSPARGTCHRRCVAACAIAARRTRVRAGIEKRARSHQCIRGKYSLLWSGGRRLFLELYATMKWVLITLGPLHPPARKFPRLTRRSTGTRRGPRTPRGFISRTGPFPSSHDDGLGVGVGVPRSSCAVGRTLCRRNLCTRATIVRRNSVRPRSVLGEPCVMRTLPFEQGGRACPPQIQMVSSPLAGGLTAVQFARPVSRASAPVAPTGMPSEITRTVHVRPRR